MKKFLRLFTICALICAMVLPTAACSCGGDDVVDSDTVLVKVLDAGFGSDWLSTLKTNFENVYKDKGYKVKFLTDSTYRGESMLREIYSGSNVDLYITGDITPDEVVNNQTYGTLVNTTALANFYNQSAIGYDGKAENQTIASKMDSNIMNYVTTDNGTIVGFNWAKATSGLVVNTRKLNAAGITQLPRTTNELFNDFATILKNSKYKPVVYSCRDGAGTGYPICGLETWMAQYDPEFYEEYFSFQKNGENMTQKQILELFGDGVKDDEKNNENEITDMLTLGYQFFDQNVCVSGCKNAYLNQTQGSMMMDSNGSAVFMFNGDWFVQEIKQDYEDSLNDITFINTPVTSTLGTKTFSDVSADKAEELLCYIIDLVDANKTVAEIVADVTANKSYAITTEQAQTIATARGTTYGRGIEHIAYINKDSKKADMCLALLNMMASDDFGETFLETAYVSTPYYSKTIELSDDIPGHEFVNSASKITSNIHYSMITGYTFGQRKTATDIVTDLSQVISGTGLLSLYLADHNTKSIYTEGSEYTVETAYLAPAKELQKLSQGALKTNLEKAGIN